jgi:hypothetical protein
MCIIAFILCAIKRKVNDFLNNKIQPYAYNISTLYLFIFIINWLLNLPNNNTCIFRLVFYLGFLWFSILLIILVSSLNNKIKYVSSGMFIGVGIALLNNQNFYGFLSMLVIGLILFFMAAERLESYRAFSNIRGYPQ